MIADYGIEMRYGVESMNNFVNKTRDIARLILRAFLSLFKRGNAANVLMVGFILFTSIGAGIFSPALGFIAAGVTCGIFGFLLGLE